MPILKLLAYRNLHSQCLPSHISKLIRKTLCLGQRILDQLSVCWV